MFSFVMLVGRFLIIRDVRWSFPFEMLSIEMNSLPFLYNNFCEESLLLLKKKGVNLEVFGRDKCG